MPLLRRAAAAALAAVAVLWCVPAHADPPPDPIADLRVASGTADGSIQLQWTAGGTHGTTQAADHYLIRYRFNNPIATETDWTNGYGIQEPPVNVVPPKPQASGSPESLVVTGLTPGTVYGFSIRPVDDTGVMASLSNSATAQATSPCPKDPDDGHGISGISVLPASLDAGSVVDSTVTVNVTGDGISTGGRITLRVPDYFPWPQLDNANQPGFVSAQVTPMGSTYSLSVESQTVTLTITSGAIPTGGAVVFSYRAQSCQLGVRHFGVATQYSSCGVLTDTGLTTDIAVVPGIAHFVDFQNFDFSTLVNQIIPVDFRSTDLCGNPAPLNAIATVPVSAVYFNGTTMVADPVATVSLASAPYVGLGSVSLVLSSGSFSGRV